MTRKLTLFFLLIFFYTNLPAQMKFGLVDGRQSAYCRSCNSIIASKPKEVLFGIQIQQNGDVYFSMDDRTWFDKIFRSKSFGITADIISRDRYDCNKTMSAATSLPKGVLLPPVYRDDLLKGLDATMKDAIYVKIGTLPSSLVGKDVEANVVILNGNNICFYTNLVDIPRTRLQLLPMGLFTDSLLKTEAISDKKETDFFSYDKVLKLEIPFEKGGAKFDRNVLKNIYDSSNLGNYYIRKADIRAYTSVEGSEAVNQRLMKQRADTIVAALKKYQPDLNRIRIVAAENWPDFFNDTETSDDDWFSRSKNEVKQKLADKAIAAEMEPILAKHRKGVITLYLESKTPVTNIANSNLLSDFKIAINENKIDQARYIQKEVVERIIDNKLPLDYINRLEVPMELNYTSLLNDQEVYKLLLKTTDEYQALDNFLLLQKLDPANGRIAYNVCALRFFMWEKVGDTTAEKILKNEIAVLPLKKIDSSLVKRMLINYHILRAEDKMRSHDYAAKDTSLSVIYQLYKPMKLTDEEIYILSKFVTYYARMNWAEELVSPRINQVDVNEDLLFYYVNILFFQPNEFEEHERTFLNALNLNQKRFCSFFKTLDKGGASMQLLEEPIFKDIYCESCGKYFGR